jgi:hypothetical protein
MVRPVSFKDEKEKDIIDYLIKNGYLDNFSYYIKGLIKRDMQETKLKNKKSSMKKNRSILNFII